MGVGLGEGRPVVQELRLPQPQLLLPRLHHRRLLGVASLAKHNIHSNLLCSVIETSEPELYLAESSQKARRQIP